jgi:2-amino-4-hydroxy-6-hydroxymethyldihydropteridine diphosphokinase
MTLWLPAYVGIGSNVGDPIAHVRNAFEALNLLGSTRLVARSPLYRTRPFGPVAQADFINAVAGLLTQLTAPELLAALRQIEVSQGRVRTQRWGPRTLDLDILVFGDAQVSSTELTLPHPGLAERGFVLAPLADIAPTLDVPGVGRVEQLLQRLPDAGVAMLVDA